MTDTERDPQILHYATGGQELTESVLEVRNGTAVLALPPPSRWTYAAMLAFFIPCLVYVAGLAALLASWHRGMRWAWDDTGLTLGIEFLASVGAYCAGQIVWAANAFQNWRRLGSRLEASRGHLIYVRRGLWRDVWRPFAIEKVQDLRIEPVSTKAHRGTYAFRFRAGRFAWRVCSSRPEFGREATAALRAAVGLPTLAPGLTAGNYEEQTRDAQADSHQTR